MLLLLLLLGWHRCVLHPRRHHLDRSFGRLRRLLLLLLFVHRQLHQQRLNGIVFQVRLRGLRLLLLLLLLD